ncbi:MAG: antitoxin [Acidimicrobiales bacterium]
MRTTLTLDDDVASLVRSLMDDRQLSFKEAVNHAIRLGLASGGGRAAKTPTFAMGQSQIPLDHAVRLAGELEDAEVVREMSARK